MCKEILTRSSIIAVPGLWADPDWTWKKRGVSFLSDLLPVDFPNARVLFFGTASKPNVMKKCQRFVDQRFVWASFNATLIGLAVPLMRRFALYLVALFLTLRSASYLLKHVSRLRATPVSEVEDQSRQLLECSIRLRQSDVSVLVHFSTCNG